MCLKLRAPIYFWRSKWKTAYIFTNFSFCYGNAPKRWFQPANGVWSTCLLVKIHNNAVLKANNKVLFDWMTQQYLKVYSLITSALRIIASIWANNGTIFFTLLNLLLFFNRSTFLTLLYMIIHIEQNFLNYSKRRKSISVS